MFACLSLLGKDLCVAGTWSFCWQHAAIKGNWATLCNHYRRCAFERTYF